MTELHVQPKKKPSLLPWLLLLLGVIALIWFLATRNKNNEVVASTTPTAITDSSDWTKINFDAASLNYDEVNDSNISVRGDSNYGIYGLGENVLFDEGAAGLRSGAESNLKKIAASIDKRYASSKVKVYGFTDSLGSSDANKELARQRATAVKMWLINNGMDSTRISINGVGEAQPVANNSTAAGRQQNRRVEIVALKK